MDPGVVDQHVDGCWPGWATRPCSPPTGSSSGGTAAGPGCSATRRRRRRSGGTSPATRSWPTRLASEGSLGFAELWAAGTVGAHREDRKIVEHPAVGPIQIDCDTLTDGDADLKIVILTAAAGTEDETKLRLATMAIQLSS